MTVFRKIVILLTIWSTPNILEATADCRTAVISTVEKEMNADINHAAMDIPISIEAYQLRKLLSIHVVLIKLWLEHCALLGFLQILDYNWNVWSVNGYRQFLIWLRLQINAGTDARVTQVLRLIWNYSWIFQRAWILEMRMSPLINTENSILSVIRFRLIKKQLLKGKVCIRIIHPDKVNAWKVFNRKGCHFRPRLLLNWITLFSFLKSGTILLCKKYFCKKYCLNLKALWGYCKPECLKHSNHGLHLIFE